MKSDPVNAVEYFVLILKKIQGSVWSEVGRTQLCPNLAWLAEQHGSGQYELRLQLGSRVLCICKADAEAAANDGKSEAVRGAGEAYGGARRLSAPGRLPNSLSQREEEAPLSDASWLRAGNAHVPARTVLRGTVPGLAR